MYVVLIRNSVTKEEKDSYITISQAFAEDMKQIKGCVDAKVWIPIDDDSSVINYELWENEEVYKKYDGEVFLRYKSELKKGFLGNTTELFTI